MNTKRDFLDKSWVEGYAKNFLKYCEEMNVREPRPEWTEEIGFYNEWLALIRMEVFPKSDANELLMRMQKARSRYGSNFENATSQVGQWITAHTLASATNS